MNDYIPYVIVGITTGSLYGLAAMGLVLTYKTSGLFNIAYGAQCALSAFLFYSLREQAGVPWPIAALLVVVGFGTVFGLGLGGIAALLANVTTTYKIVGSVGLLVAIISFTNFAYGTQARPFEPFLPTGSVFTIKGNAVTMDNIVDLAVGVVAAVGLTLFFRATRTGVAMRGVVDDPSLLAMAGTSPVQVRRISWLIGSVFAAVSGLLFASVQQQLDIYILSLLVVQAFGAAAIGRFTSVPLAYCGGLLVGLIQNIVSKEAGSHESLSGLDTNTPFLVLFLVLLISRPGRLVEVGRQLRARGVPVSRMPARARRIGYGVLLFAALLVPHVVGTKITAWQIAATQVILFASLNLLVRTSGQISLCQVGFVAIGAAGFAHAQGSGLPWLFAVLVGVLWCVPAALVVSVPAIRLSGLYLGLATLGFGVLLAQYAYSKSWFFGSGVATARPDAFGLDGETRFYYLLMAFAVGAVALVLLIERTRLGRILRGMSDSPVALSTLGTSVRNARVIVFVISGALAGLSGALYASLFVSTTQEAYPYINSLISLAVLAIAGRRTVTVAVVGPILLTVLPLYVGNDKANSLLQVAFGLAAVLVAVNSNGQLRKLLERWTEVSADRTVGPAGTRTREALAGVDGVLPPQSRGDRPVRDAVGVGGS
ncbi:hypothetical protein GCM10009547_43250 [Sporichthya brevicatena]|uniref:ABC transporter permease n=1 Tax=Sporichthya brevicatena TaxID=171442 RepID=A0ABP3SI37_9ACTN